MWNCILDGLANWFLVVEVRHKNLFKWFVWHWKETFYLYFLKIQVDYCSALQPV